LVRIFNATVMAATPAHTGTRWKAVKVVKVGVAWLGHSLGGVDLGRCGQSADELVRGVAERLVKHHHLRADGSGIPPTKGHMQTADALTERARRYIDGIRAR
jgi:hypothetical protein